MDQALTPSQSAPALAAFEKIAANLRGIMRALHRSMGNWAIEPVLMLTVYHRISATFRKTERLLLRFQKGKLWRRVSRRETAAPGRKVSRTPSVILPRRFGWLLAAGKHHAALYRAQLQVQLELPEMTALLESSEQARRVLRPLCRALAVELPWVQGEARKPREKKPRPKPEPFKIPLPRGMLTRARRDKALEKAIKLKHELVFKNGQKA